MIEVKSLYPRMRLVRWICATIFSFASIGLFVWVAYKTTRTYFVYDPTLHFGRRSGTARLFYYFLLALPWWLRPVAVLWITAFFIMLFAPLFWRSIFGRLFDEPIFAMDEFGITGNAVSGPDRFLWQDITRLDISRASRLATTPNATITLYAKAAPQVTDARVRTTTQSLYRVLITLYPILLYVLGLRWMSGKPFAQPVSIRRMTIATDRHKFDVATVMKFIRKKRPDLVDRLPSPH